MENELLFQFNGFTQDLAHAFTPLLQHAPNHQSEASAVSNAVKRFVLPKWKKAVEEIKAKKIN